MRPAGASITNDAHSALLRSDRLRADQCRADQRHRRRPRRVLYDRANRKPGRDAGSWARMIARSERRDDARAVRGREPRQRRDVEMVVCACETRAMSIGGRSANAMPGSFTRFGPTCRTARRAPTRPDRENVEARGLQQKARVPDIGDPAGGALDPRAAAGPVRRRRPGRPLCAGAAPMRSSSQRRGPGGSSAARRGDRESARRRSDRSPDRSGSGTFTAYYSVRRRFGARITPRLRNGPPHLFRRRSRKRLEIADRRPAHEAGGNRPTARCALGRFALTSPDREESGCSACR